MLHGKRWLGHEVLRAITFSYDDDNGTPNNGFAEYYPDRDNFGSVEVVVVQPSPNIRLDAVPVDTDFKPTLYGFDPKAPLNMTAQKPGLPLRDGLMGVPTYGIIDRGDLSYALYNTNATYWNLFLTNEDGSTYPTKSGDYRVLVRVLKYNADPKGAANYESWLGPIIRINRTA